MMTSSQFNRSFLRLILLAWNIPPVFGLAFIVYIQILSLDQVIGILTTPIEPAFIFGWMIFVYLYFRRYISPVVRCLEQADDHCQQQALSCMRRFTMHFWILFLVYLITAPASVIISAEIYTDYVSAPVDWFRIHLVAIIVSIIVGLPVYFMTLDLFGRVIGRFKLDKPHVTIRTKVFLIGALIPLLIDTMIVQYYWTRTGYFTTETFIVWLSLELLAIIGSIIFVRSFSQSLSPLEKYVLTDDVPDAPSYRQLVPASTDEIGVVTERYRSALRLLQQSEQQYRQLVENIPDVLYRTDHEGTIVYVSPSVARATGYQPDEVLGLKIAETFYADPDDRDGFLTAISMSDVIDDFEVRLMRKDGSICWASVNAHLLKDDDGNHIGIEGIARDITERKEVETRLNYQATHDDLTDLINRREFERRTENLIAILGEGEQHALCFLDLDQFKVVNDTCGHAAGDEMLRQVTGLLHANVRKSDILARLGGDEFGVLMEYCSLADAERMANKLLDAMREYRFIWQEQTYKAGVSIGVVAITRQTSGFTELLKQADSACYMAKELGRNRVHLYSHEDIELARRQGEMQWVSRINEALEHDRFVLHAQPILALGTDSCDHHEILIRMIGEDGDIIAPGDFLAAAERYTLIERVDRWVIRNALETMGSHPAFLGRTGFISINLSGPTLSSTDMIDYIRRAFELSAVDPRQVCFEITETAAISSLSVAQAFINSLKSIGCKFALDDFGSGLSSFGYLKHLPVDYLKIDGMFVRDMVYDPIDHAMVRSINDIGQVMGMKTIAEFAENSEIISRLRTLGVNYAQGFGIGEPRPFIELVGEDVA